MLVGHVGVAIGAFGIRKTLPLGLLIVASQLPDWVDATLCMAGVRTSIPGMLSHSLPVIAVLAVAASLFTFARSRDAAGSSLAGMVVASHVIGDYFTGSKPLWPGGPTIGLGWYDRPALDFVFEAGVITAGWLLYRNSFPAERRSSREVLAVLVALLALQLGADVLFWLSPAMQKC